MARRKRLYNRIVRLVHELENARRMLDFTDVKLMAARAGERAQAREIDRLTERLERLERVFHADVYFEPASERFRISLELTPNCLRDVSDNQIVAHMMEDATRELLRVARKGI